MSCKSVTNTQKTCTRKAGITGFCWQHAPSHKEPEVPPPPAKKRVRIIILPVYEYDSPEEQVPSKESISKTTKSLSNEDKDPGCSKGLLTLEDFKEPFDIRLICKPPQFKEPIAIVQKDGQIFEMRNLVFTIGPEGTDDISFPSYLLKIEAICNVHSNPLTLFWSLKSFENCKVSGSEVWKDQSRRLSDGAHISIKGMDLVFLVRNYVPALHVLVEKHKKLQLEILAAQVTMAAQ